MNRTNCSGAPTKCKVSQLRVASTCGAGGGGGSGGFGLMSAGHGLLQDLHAPASPEPLTPTQDEMGTRGWGGGKCTFGSFQTLPGTQLCMGISTAVPYGSICF